MENGSQLVVGVEDYNVILLDDLVVAISDSLDDVADVVAHNTESNCHCQGPHKENKVGNEQRKCVVVFHSVCSCP